MFAAPWAFLQRVERGLEEAVCGVCLCVMASCVMLQILLRFVFSAAAPWAEEVAVYSMISAVYFGACLATRERAHIRITLLHGILPQKLRLASFLLADLAWILFLGVMFSQSTVLIKLLFQTTHISPGLGIEQRWPQLLVPFCLLLMMARIAQTYWRWFKNGAHGLPI